MGAAALERLAGSFNNRDHHLDPFSSGPSIHHGFARQPVLYAFAKATPRREVVESLALSLH